MKKLFFSSFELHVYVVICFLKSWGFVCVCKFRWTWTPIFLRWKIYRSSFFVFGLVEEFLKFLTVMLALFKKKVRKDKNKTRKQKFSHITSWNAYFTLSYKFKIDTKKTYRREEENLKKNTLNDQLKAWLRWCDDDAPFLVFSNSIYVQHAYKVVLYEFFSTNFSFLYVSND